MEVQDSRGTRIELGEAIKRGGEAQIFKVRDQPDLVAKIYHAHRAEREAKLKAMLAKMPVQPATHTAIAWPIELLYEHGRLVGFLMPKISGYDPIINFYNPARRKKRHPGFNWRYLHRTASNLAVVIETVHEAGHVVGDLNESNVLVNDQALVTLVDADSFQIKGPKARIYRCAVGKPEYTARELHEIGLSSVNRRREHDYFGLAVLIFQLLMQGYHPFAGVLRTHLSVGRVDVYAIKEGLFAYHRQNSQSSHFQTPPNAPSFALLHPDLQALFARCFVDGHSSPILRPTAREWRAQLERAEEALLTCERDTTHIYSNHLATCPFCPPEQAIQAIQKPLPPADHRISQTSPVHIGAQSSPPAHQPISQTSPVHIGAPSSSVAPSRATFLPSLRPFLAFLLNIPGSVVEKAWLLMLIAIVGGLIAVNLNVFNLNNTSQTEQPVSFGTPVPSSRSSVKRLVEGEPVATIGAQNAEQIQQLASFGQGEVEQVEGVVYSPDGKLLAVASWAGLFLYDAETLEQLHFIDTFFSVHSVAFSPDGQIIACGLVDGTVRLWSLDAEPITTLSGHTHWVNSVAFSPDGKTLASASSDQTVRLWSLDTEASITLSGHTDWVRSVALSPDGQTLASGSRDGTVRLWSTDGTFKQELSGQTSPVRSLAFSPDGQILASGTEDNMVRLWSADGTLENTLSKHSSDVQSVTFSPTGSLVASGDSSGVVHLWSTDGTHLEALSGHTSYAKSVAFRPDGKILASGSSDGTVRLWGVAYPEPVATTTADPEPVVTTTADSEPAKTATQAATVSNRPSPTPSPTYESVFAGTSVPSSRSSVKRLVEGEPVVTIAAENADQIEQIGFLTKGQIREAVYSPDGHLLALASSIGIYILDAETLEQVRLIDTGSPVSRIAFSPDGKTLLSGSKDGAVQLWSTKGIFIRTLKEYKHSVESVAFSPDGKTLASSCCKTVELWSTDGTHLHTLSGHSDWVNRVAFSPDGKMLASASDDQTVRLWSTDGTLIRVLSGHTRQVASVVFSPDGQMLASVSDNVRLWETSGTLIRVLEGGRSVAFSPDGKTLASALSDELRLWSIDGTGMPPDGAPSGPRPTLINTLSGHTRPVTSVGFNPDGKTLASLSYDQTVRLWETSGKMIRVLERHATSVNSVAVSKDRSFVAFASDHHGVQLWSMDGTLQAAFEGRFVALSPDSSLVVSASSNSVFLWSTDGRLITTLKGHTEWVTSIAVSNDGKTLAFASDDHHVRLWSTDGTLIRVLEGHTDSAMSVAFSPDSKTLASGSKDGTIRLWSTSGTGMPARLTLINTLSGHTDWVRGVAFSPDGKTLASASDDNTVRLWSTDGTLIRTLEGHTNRVSHVAFSPNGQILASASWDKTMRLWSTDGTPMISLEGHTERVNDLAFSPDGQILASASSDGTVRLWGVPP